MKFGLSKISGDINTTRGGRILGNLATPQAVKGQRQEFRQSVRTEKGQNFVNRAQCQFILNDETNVQHQSYQSPYD
ncbi:hypothetical protein SAMN05421890_0071 [Ensifer adhaerens]|nr:hypothetical protein SAMN05421890_0071 [Ensifer adhaerens]